MKPELWLNRADHELSLAQELLDAGSLLWAVSYAHRSVEYALEGLIFLKTGIRPEKGSQMDDLHTGSRCYLPDAINSVVSDLVKITPLVWNSDLNNEKLIGNRAKSLIEGAKKTVMWFSEECEKGNSQLTEGTTPQS